MGDKAAVTLALRGHLRGLETLHIAGCYKLSDAALAQLLGPARESALRSLDLTSNSRLGHAGLTAVARLSRLQNLTLDHAPHLTDESLLALLGGGEGPPLQHLSLAGLIQVTDSAIKAILRHFGRDLRHLNLAGCSLLTGESLFEIRAHCKQLRELDISRLSDVPTAALLALFLSRTARAEELAAKATAAAAAGMGVENGTPSPDLAAEQLPPLPPLRSVRLASMAHATDDVLRHLASSSGTHLVRLDISGCHKLSGRSAMMIATHCVALEALDVSFVRGFSSEALVHVVDSCRQLSHLHVWGCTQLSEVFYNGHSNMDLLVVGQSRAF